MCSVFVDKFYHKETYIKCYDNCIQPTNGAQLWPKTSMNHVLPPYYYKLKGRPNAGARRLENDEKKNKKGADPYKLGKHHQQSLKCENCGKVGHNKKSCKDAYIENVVLSALVVLLYNTIIVEPSNT